MAVWLLRRIVIVLLSAFAAMTIVFWLNFLVPADSATATLSQSSASQEVVERRRAELGLDRPPAEQYLRYVSSLVRLDFGHSWANGQAVSKLVISQLGPTVSLAVSAIAVATILGMVGGVLSFSNTWLARWSSAVSVVALAVPLIFSGTLSIWLFAIQLDWLPATGQGRGAQLVLPSLVLGVNGAGAIFRVVRAAILESIESSWVIAARARGLSRIRVWVRHIIRPSLLPVLNVIGLQFGYLLGGVAVVETLFARSGIGRVLVSAVLNKDLPVVLAVVLMVGLAYGSINLCIDGLYLGLDPRLRSSLNA